MIQVDFPSLRKEIKDAARRAFEAVTRSHPSEGFYAFALYSDDGAMTVAPAANSEEGLVRKAQEYSYSDIPDWLRWSTAEWDYEHVGSEHFAAVHEILNVQYDCSETEFEAFRTKLYETMIQALGDLDAEEFFGTKEMREAVTVFCSISDSDGAEQLEDASAQQLNPSTVYEKFKNRKTDNE